MRENTRFDDFTSSLKVTCLLGRWAVPGLWRHWAPLKRREVSTGSHSTASQETVIFMTKHDLTAGTTFLELFISASKLICIQNISLAVRFYVLSGDIQRLAGRCGAVLCQTKVSPCMPSINLQVSCLEGKITHSSETAVTKFLSTCYFLNGVQRTRSRRVGAEGAGWEGKALSWEQ
jgi:hypothetical protein